MHSWLAKMVGGGTGKEMVDIKKEKVEPVFVNVEWAQESIPPGWESIPGLHKKVYKFGTQDKEWSRNADDWRQKVARRSKTREVLNEILPCKKQCRGSRECWSLVETTAESRPRRSWSYSAALIYYHSWQTSALVRFPAYFLRLQDENTRREIAKKGRV